jgi:uncharacterized phiE125 gp8 family phage protein
MYVIDVVPVDEPVTLEEARLQVRIDAPSGAEHHEDALVLSLITAAREAVEKRTERLFVEREVEVVMDCLPLVVHLPVAPVSAIVSVTYLDGAGDVQTLDPAAYSLYAHPDRPEMALDPLYVLPEMAIGRSSVRVRVTAGPDADNPIPRAVAQAILLTVADLYANRESTSATSLFEIPHGPDRLLQPYMRGLVL